MAPDDLKTYPLKSFFSELFKVIILGAFAVVAIRYFVFKPFVVKGASMEPNFREKEYLIIDELTYRLNEPQRGDIVVLRNQGQDDQDYFLKRVVALPGERIVIMNGRVKIYNAPHTGGKFLDESLYLSPAVLTFGDMDVTLKADQYFVLGDNRPASLDSRRIGPVARSEIVGRAFLRGWPLSRIEYLAKDYARD
ncbi:MAG: signal peptidase I [Candidatus Magasanikbacteria bacterium RIFCSPHIGHO2_02_FULL_50_9b]|uniref:Signal peptidase I n=1 Tax=Candidatus Magasanikbacteria bacterium RIFCSPHIGHO2_02_FULL_50_9b TaxID=1798682 RepID=A0A1F6M8W5_9BACT|nr:MAG: signal peptidase I [Candidatus Magasanikbacteria bacterium RIFCSPHIGHO2_02_FULL_50_9b]